MKQGNKLARIATSNILFNTDFLKDNLRDPSLAEEFIKRSVRTARITAIVLGLIMIITLLSIVYRFERVTATNIIERELEFQKNQLKVCVHNTRNQQELAAMTQMQLNETSKRIALQLIECEK